MTYSTCRSCIRAVHVNATHPSNTSKQASATQENGKYKWDRFGRGSEQGRPTEDTLTSWLNCTGYVRNVPQPQYVNLAQAQRLLPIDTQPECLMHTNNTDLQRNSTTGTGTPSPKKQPQTEMELWAFLSMGPAAH